ncbi:preprotein translocase subunit SecE [Candidatus Shapirobacteria bacterium]|nr:preprotein translocase subunit SecE [Candidatus Shapirobacteria bacterium]
MPKGVNFFSEVIDQLKQVTWPDRETAVMLTSVVILVSAVVALYLGGLDVLFTRLVGILVK